MNHIAHTGSIASTDKKDTIDAIAFRGDTMARRSDLEMTKAQVQDSNRCPLNAFSQAAGGKYKMRILWDLQEGPRRYGDLRRSAIVAARGTPVTPRVLSRELK